MRTACGKCRIKYKIADCNMVGHIVVRCMGYDKIRVCFSDDINYFVSVFLVLVVNNKVTDVTGNNFNACKASCFYCFVFS